MKLEIIWSKFAENQLDGIFEYYFENASPKVAKELLENLLAEPNRLINNPTMGQIEILLKERKTTYRYLIFKNYKIIYSIDPKKRFIKIADVFDTRQNPSNIERSD